MRSFPQIVFGGVWGIEGIHFSLFFGGRFALFAFVTASIGWKDRWVDHVENSTRLLIVGAILPIHLNELERDFRATRAVFLHEWFFPPESETFEWGKPHARERARKGLILSSERLESSRNEDGNAVIGSLVAQKLHLVRICEVWWIVFLYLSPLWIQIIEIIEPIVIEMNSVVLRGWKFGREMKVSVNIVRKRE